MRSSTFLFSAVQFLITVAVLLGALFFLFLPSAPHVQVKLSSFFLERSDLFMVIGSTLLVLGVVLLLSFYAINRHSYYQIEMDVAVQPLVIQKILETYWKNSFPKQHLITEILVHKDQKIEIVIKSSTFEIEQELEKIERDIGALLLSRLGYKQKFLLTVFSEGSV